MVTSSQKISYQEYLRYDDGTDRCYELVDGELLLMNPPAKKHFNITRLLMRVFEDEISRQKLDIEVFAGIGVRTGLDKARIPDLSLIDGEQWRNIPDDASAVIEVPLLLVIEIVSPGKEQIARDYTEKVAEYQNTGIPEYWIVDPIEQKLTVLVLEQGNYTKTVFTTEETIASTVFPELKVTAKEILSA